MSIYVSRRREALAKFIQAASELRKVTEEAAEKFPKSWRYTVTDEWLNMARKVHHNCLRANAVLMNKDTSEQDYNLRHRYLMTAGTETKALLGEMTYAWDRIKDGSNVFDGKGSAARFFKRWGHAGTETLRLVANLIASDEKRWKKYQSERK